MNAISPKKAAKVKVEGSGAKTSSLLQSDSGGAVSTVSTSKSTTELSTLSQKSESKVQN